MGGTCYAVRAPRSRAALAAAERHNAINLYGAEIHLIFDPALFAVEDADPAQPGTQVGLGPLLTSNAHFVALNRADNRTGRIDLAITQLNPTAPVSDSGVLARINLRVLAPSIGSLHITSATLADRNGTVIPATTQDGTVLIGPPAVAYVDSRWAGTAALAQVAPGKFYGFNAFAAIQSGADAVAAGGSIIVVSGTYPENLSLSKPAHLVTDGAVTLTGTPWLTTAIKSVSSAAGINPTVVNTGANVTANAVGTGSVIIAHYAANPGNTPSFSASGQYYDVRLSGSFSGMNIQFCGLAPDTLMYFWNGTAWSTASHQRFSNGCVTVSVENATVPNLTHLTGTPFAAGIPFPLSAPAVEAPAPQASSSAFLGNPPDNNAAIPTSFAAPASTPPALATPQPTLALHPALASVTPTIATPAIARLPAPSATRQILPTAQPNAETPRNTPLTWTCLLPSSFLGFVSLVIALAGRRA